MPGPEVGPETGEESRSTTTALPRCAVLPPEEGEPSPDDPLLPGVELVVVWVLVIVVEVGSEPWSSLHHAGAVVVRQGGRGGADDQEGGEQRDEHGREERAGSAGHGQVLPFCAKV